MPSLALWLPEGQCHCPNFYVVKLVQRPASMAEHSWSLYVVPDVAPALDLALLNVQVDAVERVAAHAGRSRHLSSLSQIALRQSLLRALCR